MPAKSKTIFMCRECGNEAPRWEGQCRACGAWNSLEEVTAITSTRSSAGTSRRKGERVKATKLSDIDTASYKRVSTNISEMDRTLSGGLVLGQVILLGGHPGVGKSTLLMQLADKFTGNVLYVSGEESESQIALRAERLKVDSSGIEVLSTNNVDEVLQVFNHDLIIIDSIQVMSTDDISSQAGSVSQVRECAARIVNLAKRSNIPAIIIGHITKEGSIAGPKVLEHMVDTVLYLEGDKSHLFRMLRVHKNRFGDDSEVGLFLMEALGLKAVKNPAEMLIDSEAMKSSGTAVAIVLEGSRPLAVEVQALTTKTSFGYPKRAVSGFSLNRLQLLCAVIQKRLNIDLLDQDVYVNIASGLTIKEPAVDLAVCAAIVSSYKNRPIDRDMAFFGEVGLSGEVRRVVGSARRIKEAKILGFSKTINAEVSRDLRSALKFS